MQQQTVDEAISHVLHDHQNSRDVVLRVGPNAVSLLSSSRDEVGVWFMHAACYTFLQCF